MSPGSLRLKSGAKTLLPQIGQKGPKGTKTDLGQHGAVGFLPHVKYRNINELGLSENRGGGWGNRGNCPKPPKWAFHPMFTVLGQWGNSLINKRSGAWGASLNDPWRRHGVTSQSKTGDLK